MANAIAVSLDRKQVGEMSCIAGVGGGVRSLVRVAKSGRPIVALDGCVLKCVEACLARHDLKPNVHFVLTEFGVDKKQHVDFSAAEKERAEEKIVKCLDEIAALI